MRALGLDTSNYTCSAAIYDSDTGKTVQVKRPLPVREKALGLRQSDAVFEHVRILNDVVGELFEKVTPPFDVIGVSVRPRMAHGSYMPCFLVGKLVAESLGAATEKPVHAYSHQQGHIAAALLGESKLSWLEKDAFFALHLSGGTTDCLLVTPKHGRLETIQTISTSLDLKAGQLIDRVGQMLGLSFPAGPQLDKLAQQCQEVIPVRVCVTDQGCCLSGVQNICQKAWDDGKPAEYVAKLCILCVQDAVEKMLKKAQIKYGTHPVLFAGGVSGNLQLRAHFLKWGGTTTCFAPPSFSADNAAGVALLAFLEEEHEKL